MQWCVLYFFWTDQLYRTERGYGYTSCHRSPVLPTHRQLPDSAVQLSSINPLAPDRRTWSTVVQHVFNATADVLSAVPTAAVFAVCASQCRITSLIHDFCTGYVAVPSATTAAYIAIAARRHARVQAFASISTTSTIGHCSTTRLSINALRPRYDHISTSISRVANRFTAPGPIPATTPLVVRQDNNGVQWIAFEYSRDRVKMEYTIRCDVESVNVEELSPEFKTANCVYPRACCNKDSYKGNRLHYESECNAVGWALAQLNPNLREKRGLIQRAVDSWRNSNQDVRLRSRRVRRMAKINNRNASKSTTGGQYSGPHGPGSAGLPPQGMPGSGRPSMGPGGPQLHHHHSDGTDSGAGNDVSGMFHQM
jgi:hypothetical protein